MFKFFHHQPPSIDQVAAQQLYEAQIDLLTAEMQLESAQANAEKLRLRVKRLTTHTEAIVFDVNKARRAEGKGE